MSIIKYLAFVFILFSLSSFSQKNEVIELNKLYQKEKFNNLKKATKYAEEAVFFCKKIKNDSLKLISNYHLLEAYDKQRLVKKGRKIAKVCINLAVKTKNRKILSLSYIYLSQINRRIGNYTKSLSNLEDALKIALKNNDILIIHKIINNKAILFKKTNNYNKAKRILNKVINKKNYNSTLEKAYSFNILGNLYLPTNKDSSVYFYKKAIKTIEKVKNDYAKTTFLLNLGDVLIQKKKYNDGIKILNRAKKIALKTLDNESLLYIHTSIAIHYHDQKNFSLAIKNYDIALKKYAQYVDKNQKAHLYWLSSEALYFNKQFEKGFLYQEKYIELQDSLFTIDKNRTFEKLQTEYDVAKKNDQIAFLEKEKVLEAKQKKLIYGIGGLIGSILLLLVFIYRNRIKSQKIIQKQEQQLFLQEKAQLEQDQKLKHIEGYIAGEEKEKNRIAMELHDGIGGQLSGVKHFVTSLQSTEATNELLQNITDISKEVRLLSHSLSSNFSIQQPLTHLLQTLQQRYKNHFSIEISLFPEVAIQKITTDQKVFLYRTIQELINNIYKYAVASSVELSITISEDITLIVEDNGTGFDTANTANGIGLQNIKERVKTLHGTFEVDSVLQRGTSILIKIPKDHG